MYEVVYLPTARHELEEIVEYLAVELKAPDAALDFIDAIDAMVHGLVDMPYRHPLYHANFRLTHEIRFVPVGNYNVFYAVMEESKTVEIRRVIYQRRDTRRM